MAEGARRSDETDRDGAPTDPKNDAPERTPDDVDRYDDPFRSTLDDPFSERRAATRSTGPTVSSYEVGREVARGGLGRILEAHDGRLDRRVALKELHTDTPTASTRFAREVRITARLQHPNIVPIHEAGTWPEGGPYYTMRFVDGRTLSKAVLEARTLEARLELLPAVVDVADAIAYAHSQGVIHRDLKPANVLVGPFGETVVIDWGLAKPVGETEKPSQESVQDSSDGQATKVGSVIGTPAYMPPEQARGKPVDERADVYAIGAILYHLIAGKHPYGDEAPLDYVQAVRRGPPTNLAILEPKAPRELLAIIDKAMARDPDGRYPTAEQMAAELRRFMTGGLVDAYRYGLWDRVARVLWRYRAVVITAMLGFTLVAALLAYGVSQIADERDAAERSALAEKDARELAEGRIDALVLEKARLLLAEDPTLAAAHLKAMRTTLPGAATVAAQAEDDGVALRILRGHEHLVWATAFAPDGRSVASASNDKTVRVWSLRTGEARVLKGHTERATAVKYSTDGRSLLSASYDGTLRIWNVESGQSRVWRGHKGAVTAIAFGPGDGKAASVGADGTVRIWDVASGRARPLKAPVDRETFVSFSPDGKTLLSGSHAGVARLWTLEDGSHRELAADRKEIEIAGATFSPDGTRVASAWSDGAIRIWSTTGEETTVLPGSDGALKAVAYSPDGTQLASASMTGIVRLWNLSAGTSRLVARHDERVAVLAFSPTGRHVASAGWDRTMRVWDVVTESETTLRGHGDVVGTLSFSKGGDQLVSGSWDKTLRVWPLRSKTATRVLRGHTVGVKALTFSPDGKTIASGGHDDQVRLWDVVTGRHRVLEGHGDHVYRVLFSPDGRWVASSSDDKTVRVWPVSGGTARVLEGHEADVEELAFSADGRWLASAAEDDTARLWDTKTDRSTVLNHGHHVSALAFSPDGKWLATGSRDRRVRLWAVPKSDARMLEGHEGEVHDLDFSSDGKLLASAADDGLRIWDVKSGKARAVAGVSDASLVEFSPDDRMFAVGGRASELWLCEVEGDCTALSGHRAIVRDFQFTRDGRLLVTGGGDGLVFVWDVETGERRILRGHASGVFDIDLSPDETKLASASADETVRLWPVEPPPRPEQLGALLERLTREAVESNPE